MSDDVIIILELQKRIGKKVISLRSKQIAEIVGWNYCYGKYLYAIRFENMQTIFIPVHRKDMEITGYRFEE